MMAYIVWNISPNVIPEFEYLRWYGLSWLTGMALGYQLVLRIYKSEGTPTIELDKLTTYVMLGGIIGARFGHILFYDPIYYWNNPIEILPIRLNPTFEFTGLTGLASHGGILGALIALYFYNRKFQKGYLWLLDRLMIGGVALGGCIRLGNLMNSEILGIPSEQSWAFIFTRIDQIPRHPAQLYEAIFYFIACAILYFVWRSRKFQSNTGFTFGLGIFMVFVQRFLIEFLKENQVAFEEALALNMGQLLSIPLALVGVAVMIWALSRRTMERQY